MRTLILGLILVTGAPRAGEWHVDGSAANRVVFHSSTTLLDFKGETDALDGYIYIEKDSLPAENAEVYIEVSPAAFNTGNGKRDRDMREDVLHTDKYPLSWIRGRLHILERDAAHYKVVVRGMFFLHGVSRPVDINGTMVARGKYLSVEGRFSVFLKDYNIRAPELLAFIKVAEKIDISARITLIRVK